MIIKPLTRFALAATLALSIPAAVAAQEEAITPEGTTWHLTSYADDGLARVPFYVQATLTLVDGMASGSSGCNSFNGSYELEGSSLTFGEEFATTRAGCPDDATAAVEDGYLAALPDVAAWSLEGEELRLSDADGELLLVYEEPVVALTRSAMADIAALLGEQQSEITRASERIDNIRIGTLRDRIKELEGTVASLQAQAAAASSNSGSGSGSASGGGSAFSASEKVLNRYIPAKIRSTCSPLRGSGLPAGTVAAVQCQPDARIADEMAYYLMELPDARRTLRTVAQANGASKGGNCRNGRAGFLNDLPLMRMEGCWVDGGKAQVRVADTPTGCTQLDVAGTRMRNPVVYAAIEGSGDKIKPLFTWAYSPGDFLDWGYTVIRQGRPTGLPNSPLCDDGIGP